MEKFGMESKNTDIFFLFEKFVFIVGVSEYLFKKTTKNTNLKFYIQHIILEHIGCVAPVSHTFVS